MEVLSSLVLHDEKLGISTLPCRLFTFTDTEYIFVGTNAIHKYDSEAEQWSEHIKYGNLLAVDEARNYYYSYIAALDESQLLYILTSDDRLIQIDLKCKTIKTMTVQFNFSQESDGDANESGKCVARFAVLRDQMLHLISFDDSDNEAIDLYYRCMAIDTSKDTLLCEEIRVCHDYNPVPSDLDDIGYVYLKTENTILLMGGATDDDHSQTIYCYSIESKKWSKLPFSLPRKMAQFGCVITSNQQNIVICGGKNDEEKFDDILVVDLNTNTITKSKLSVPFKGAMVATLMTNIGRKQLVIMGYLRASYKSEDLLMRNMSLIIQPMLCSDYVHLINDKGKHWRVAVQDLISN